MTKRMVSGNEAVAYAALRSGAKVISGYPGTPSSEVIGSLMKMGKIEGTEIEWSTNEKVAVEIAATAAWAGKRSLCTMKMSGLNVAYDSMIGIAFSGCIGGMVVYVCDDPGVTTGMCEQDTRGFALMSDMVMLEPASVQESYDFVKYAFELSEEIKHPVFVRSVTNVAQSHSLVDIEERVMPNLDVPVVKKDINRYAKAGAVMCMNQHRELIESLEQAADILEKKNINKLTLVGEKGGIGLITTGVCNGYINEALDLAAEYGCKIDQLSTLRISASVPYPVKKIQALLEHCAVVAVVEENDPYIEREAYVQAHTIGVDTKIIGKLDKTLSRVGSFSAIHVAKALCKACGMDLPAEILNYGQDAAAKCAARPITCCAGCPHRGTYMAINKAIRNAKLKKEDVIVTGDIGCTILGMNPPFDTVWMEISMGASIPCAHGFVYSGVDKPVIATIGDSTFFHGGMPGLVNAIQHNINMTAIIMDNGWTAMTGMQVNPNTASEFQVEGCINVDLVNVVKGMGVKNLFIVDPYDLKETTAALDQALALPGLKVIVARRECAIQTNRRKVKYSKITVDYDKCNSCKLCINITGCPAIEPGEKGIVIDPKQCNGCGLCAQTCTKSAIVREVI
ncbi:MAG: thiamine pyrophosphate-dependent enzyme [Bacillota bacterium]